MQPLDQTFKPNPPPIEGSLPPVATTIHKAHLAQDGRISLPEEIRDLLGKSFFGVRLRSRNQALLFSQSGVEQFTERLDSFLEDTLGAERRAYQRVSYPRLKELSLNDSGVTNLSKLFNREGELPAEVNLECNLGLGLVSITPVR